MTKLRTLVAGAVLALAFIGGLWAQTSLTNRSMSGNEVVSMAQGGPGGPSLFVAASQLRNATGMTTTALTSGTLVLNNTTGTLVSTAASASLAVTLPPLPWDGEIFEWVNGSGAAFTGATVTVSDGATLVNNASFATLAAGASVEFRYALATTSWYRVR
jgi:predicted acylesterase/phospholipase RssA